MDNETSYKSTHDAKTFKLDKQEIIKWLKNCSKVKRVSLPRDIDFLIVDGGLKVIVKNVTYNMQTNSAAFEGWVLVMKTWLSDAVKYVELDFEEPEFLPGPSTHSSIRHYNRFLYRIDNMIRLFPHWFFLHPSKTRIVSEFMQWLKSNTCLLNRSTRERSSVIKTKNMERQIESWFAFEEGKEQICKLWDIDTEKLFNQLPVGIFYEKVASKNAIFTGGASAIDLWGIGNDGVTLHLIELKCGDNKGIGVISEVLFYAAILYDTCVNRNNLFTFGEYGKPRDTTDLTAIKNAGRKFDNLYVHVLAEQYHPLFSSEVENLARAGLSSLGINFDYAIYNYLMGALK